MATNPGLCMLSVSGLSPIEVVSSSSVTRRSADLATARTVAINLS